MMIQRRNMPKPTIIKTGLKNTPRIRECVSTKVTDFG